MLNEFYEKEYEMLKDARFQTSHKITSFFQYALLIFSAPLALLASEYIQKELEASVECVDNNSPSRKPWLNSRAGQHHHCN